MRLLNKDRVLVGRKLTLRSKHLKDAVDDYAWCSDIELCSLDATTPTVSSFKEYLADYTEELRHSGWSHRFAIETLDGKHIGNCACFNIDNVKKDAEIGIMIGDRDYWNQGYGVDTIITLLRHIFSQVGLSKVYLKTLDWNVRAQKCFEKCGFTPCGQIIRGHRKFIVMEAYPSSMSLH